MGLMGERAYFHHPSIGKETLPLWTFGRVEDAMVEAWGYLRRLPDREGALLRSAGVSSIWRQAVHEGGDVWHRYAIDYFDQEPVVAGGLNAKEVAHLDKVLMGSGSWMERVPERDRKLVGIVLDERAKVEAGARSGGFGWDVVRRRLGQGGRPVTVSVDALRRRYERALAKVCAWVNRVGV